MLELIKTYLRQKLYSSAPTNYEPREILPRPKQGEVWALNGHHLLVGQVEYPYLALYNVVRQDCWYGHIKDAGDIYKVEDTWLMKEVHKQTKTLEEFVQLR